MQTTLSFPIGELRSRVADARQRIDRAPKDLYPLLAVELEQLAEQSFLRRSTGAPDVGITWNPLTERTRQWKQQHGWPANIGIADGELLGSLKSGASPDGFEVQFAANFAGLFNARRQLLPGELPDEWDDRLSETAQEWLDDVLTFE